MTNDPDPAVTSLEFTEEMKGYVSFGERDFEAGLREGKDSGTFLMFHLTIEADDIDRFIADPEHAAAARGWVRCEELGGQLPVEDGLFNLFVATTDPMLKKMRYRLYFSGSAGNPLTLAGFKDIQDDPGFDLWSDTTTLYVRILRGHVDSQAEADVVASGILRIYMRDFARQLTTFRARGGSLVTRTKALSDFGRLFLGELWELYRGKAETALTHEGRDDD